MARNRELIAGLYRVYAQYICDIHGCMDSPTFLEKLIPTHTGAYLSMSAMLAMYGATMESI